MIDQSPSIDVSSLDRYLDLEDEHRILAQRLERLELEKGRSSEVVYQRVKGDYERQIARVVEEILSLREVALITRSRLQALLPTLDETIIAATYEKEELQLRWSLGEFTEVQVRPRIATLEEKLTEATAQLAILKKLDSRLNGDFASHETTEPAPARRGSNETIAVDFALPELPAASPAPVEATPAQAQEASPPLPAPDPAEPLLFKGTQLIRFAYLDFADPLPNGESKYYLGPLTRIGRTSENQVNLDDTSVSRTHAEILLTPEGYRIRNLSTVNGTFVNGDQVTEHLLQDGDRVLVGSKSFRFHMGDGV